MAKFLDETGLAYFWDRIKSKLSYATNGSSTQSFKYFDRNALGGSYCRIPFVEHSENALICGGDIRSAGQSDIEPIEIGIARTEDDGKTWTKQIVLTRPTTYSNSRVMDGCIAVDRSINRVFVFGHYIDSDLDWSVQTEVGMYTDCVYRYSDDDGKTWSEQISLRSVLGNGTDNIITCFAGVGKGIYTTDGKIVVPFVEKRTNLISTGIFYSSDHGETWTKSSVVGRDANEPQLVEKDGYIYINSRNVVLARSVFRTADFGNTWEYMPEMSTLIQPPNGVCCGFDSYDSQFGKVFVFSGCDSKSSRSNIVIKQSYDLIRWENVYSIREHADGANGYTSLTNYKNVVYCVSEYSGELYVLMVPKDLITITNRESLLTIVRDASSEADLNNYVSTGTYTVDASAIANTGLNFPKAEGGILYVTARPWNLQVYQKYTTFGGDSFERTLRFIDADHSEWTQWHRLTLGIYSSGDFSASFSYITQTTAPTSSPIQTVYTKYGPFVNFFWRGTINTVGNGSELVLTLPWTVSNRTAVSIYSNKGPIYQNFVTDKRVFIRKTDYSAVSSSDIENGLQLTIGGTIIVNE